MKCKLRPFTNFDWLHSLSQEKLAKEISELVCGTLRNCLIDMSDEEEQEYTQFLTTWMKHLHKEN